MKPSRRTLHARVAATAAVAVALLGTAAIAPLSSSADPSLSQLNSALSATQAHAQALSSSVGNLNGLIGTLGSQIAFVQQRESAVRVELAQDQANLARVTASLAQERKVLAILVARLERARALLARQLVSGYESDRPDLITVILESRGFRDLLDKIQFLKSAENEQNTTIQVTRTDKQQANAAAQRLATLEASDRQVTAATSTRVQALAGMNSLLQSKQCRAPAGARGAGGGARRDAGARPGAAGTDRTSPGPAGGGPAGRSRGAQPAVRFTGAVRFRRRRGQLGDPELGGRLRVGWAEPDAEQRRRVRLLPDHPKHLEAVRRQRVGRVPGTEVRAERGRPADLDRRLGREQLGLRRMLGVH